MSITPEKIGKYKIIEEVGRGSMGSVYSAHDPFADVEVAIKLAHSEHVTEKETGERFKKLFFNEAQAAGVLNHPSILNIFDADIDGESCYLVMEYIRNAKTLDRYCKPDSLLPIRDVVGIIYKIAKALDYAHRQGIIHRDIKPNNILQTETLDIKIADFSIAMIIREDFLETQFHGFLGSPLYMSPEQINEWQISTNTDIFSLGIVMYEMLTGHHPFKADNLSAISKKITSEKPLSLIEFRNDIPEGLEYALKRMLKKSPDKRYNMGLDLAADLALIFEDLDSVENQDSLRDKFETVQNLGFFQGFTDADIWELIRACDWHKYPINTHIIKEGEEDHSFYIVLSGLVIVEKNGQQIDSLQEGDCFGEMGYLANAKRSASVIAKTDVSLIQVNSSTLDRAAEETQLRFLKVFVKTLIGRLADTTYILTQNRQQD
jgi:eukaryotic-like serine/threonine-protein kinase